MSLETITKLQTVTLSGSQPSVSFSNIPQGYTDLKLVASLRGDGTTQYAKVSFNGDTTAANYTQKQLSANGSASSSGAFAQLLWEVNRSSYTASTFANCEATIPNYTGNIYKTYFADSVNESNGATAYMTQCSGSWANPSPITSITFTIDTGANFVSGSTFYLYGIKNLAKTAGNSIKATGGKIVFDGTYVYHVFDSTGTFVSAQPLTVDAMVVAGGGSGGFQNASGGGAGGLVPISNQYLTPASYTVTIGAGGAGAANSANNGTNSRFSSFTEAIGGGRGGGFWGGGSITQASGGSGGGGCIVSYPGASGTNGQGNAGGTGINDYAGAGGGGAGGVGGSVTVSENGGTGGVGSSTYSQWGLATGTGQNVSGVVYFAGGGGGAGNAVQGVGGNGGGGTGSGVALTGAGASGLPYTGGGGGGARGASNGGNGGSGITIIRYRG